MIPYKAIISMLCITSIVIVAIIKGQDGFMLAGALSALTGLGGFALGQKVKK